MTGDVTTTVDLGNLVLGTIILFGGFVSILGLTVVAMVWLGDHWPGRVTSWTWTVMLTVLVLGVLIGVGYVGYWVSGEPPMIERHFPIVHSETVTTTIEGEGSR